MSSKADVSVSSINEKSSFREIAGVKTHIWEGGEGAPLVLIHGFMGTFCDWRLNMNELARYFAVKAFDLPGFGYSGKPANFDYTTAGYAAFLTALLDELKIEKAAMVGNSLGGQIALMTCLKYPERVSSLVLIDSGGCPGCVNYPLFKLLRIRVLGEVMMSLVSPLSVRYALGSMLKDRSSITGDTVAYYYDLYKTPNARKAPIIVIRKASADEEEIAGGLNRINCPTLIIWGADDNVIPVSYAHMFNRSIANSSLMIIDDAGHLPQIDKADTVNRVIRGFLAAL